ncbi:glycoside hydrolase family 3 protein [Pseudocercospora fijiensis CIRAD86]|uniref:Glycoside hydrolase family 3 protein n=1 Tax=Pseudocercospora fijiensis (strain CIRAD86) TaxID=383855 RepID=M3AKT5_PSEFD|nr:glycoside hydrolase family 3 protein [Pseudocercospora fijiensis CIRAD86]EME85186.1 glycoside hydrolase family 3 protein [Pseudocercospora fijiensis CIRAD86]
MRAISLLLVAQAAISAAKTQASDATDVGLHVIWSYPGPNVPQELTDAVKAGKVGGVIFYDENIKNAQDFPGQVKALQEAYQESSAYQGFPLLMVTDQEGGTVNRFPGGPDSAKTVGQASDPAAAGTKAGATVARIFAANNINGDLAPVLDVSRKAGDFTDREQRSFGSNPGLVAKAAGPWIAALQSAGYPATAKHFPGLGTAAADANTDLKPVTLTVSAEELRRVDMKPYETAIANNVSMVMTSWAIYPALDDENPAGLSRTIVQQELRLRLRFQGVTITDALEAGSLKAFGNTGELAVKATQAGMDILLASVRDVKQGNETYSAVLDALSKGEIDRGDFREATERIVRMRSSLKN